MLLTPLRALHPANGGQPSAGKRLSKANSSPQVKSTERSTTVLAGSVPEPTPPLLEGEELCRTHFTNTRPASRTVPPIAAAAVWAILGMAWLQEVRSRVVPDIPAFCRELVAALAEEYRGLTSLEAQRSQGRNSMRIRRNASGLSMCGECPQLAKISSR